MTFLAPAWLLLAPIGIFAIAILHRRQEKQTYVGSLYVWKRLDPARHITRERTKVRLTRSLVLQVLATVAAALALAEPQLVAARTNVHHVIVLDTAYRIQVEGESIETMYRRMVSRALDGWDGSSPISIILAEARPRIALARSHSRQALERVMAALAASDTGPNWQATALKVQSLSLPAESTQVRVISSTLTGKDLELLRNEVAPGKVTVVMVPVPGNNVGFVDADVRPLEMGASSTWEIEGHIKGQITGNVTVTVEYQRIGSTSWLDWQEQSVELDSTVPTRFKTNVTLPGPGLIKLTLPGDALVSDDIVYFVLNDEVRTAKVLLIGGVDTNLVRALAAVPDVLIQRSPDLPANSSDYDLVIVDGVSVARHPGTSTIWIGATQDAGPLARIPAATGLVNWEDHILNGGSDWRNLELPSIWALPEVDGARVLLRMRETPLIQFQHHNAGVDLEMAFGFSDGNASQLAAPVIFLDNFLRLLVPNLGKMVGPSCSAGAKCYFTPHLARVLTPQLVVTSGSLRALLGITGEELRPAPYGPTLPMFIPRVAGVYSNGISGAEELIAVNGFSSFFGSLPEPLPEQEATTMGLDLGFQVSPRRLLLLLVSLLVLAEALLAVRADVIADLDRRVPGRFLRRHIVPATLVAVVGGALVGTLLRGPEGPGLETVLLIDDLAGADIAGEAKGWQLPMLDSYISSVLSGSQSGGIVTVASNSAVTSDSRSGDSALAIGSSLAGADLLAALDIATAMGDERTRILLVSSGASTRGDVTQIFELLGESGLAVDVYTLPQIPTGEMMIERVLAPKSMQADQEIQIISTLYSDIAQESEFRMSIEGEVVDERSLSVEAGRTSVESTITVPGSASLLKVDIFPSDDVFVANNFSGVVLNVRPNRPVLVVANVESQPAISEALRSRGVEVDTVVPELAPWTIDRWLKYRAIVLVDVAADQLGVGRQEQLLLYVRDHGGGLLITGGPNSFGAGGYLGSPLEEVAPLSSMFPRDAPEAALIFILDRSGSMQQPVGTSNRLDLAKQAVLEAIALLPGSNMVSIIAFDSEPLTVLQLQEVGSDTEAVASSLGRLFPSGGTDAYPALVNALEMASKLELETIHVVLLSDGLSQPADFPGLLEQFRQEGITVSTVAIGQSANAEQLREIARLGGGAFHQSVDLATLPSILSQEALLMSSSPIEEGQFQPTILDTGSDVVEGLNGEYLFQGLVLTTAKPDSLVMMEKGPDVPLLAGWQYGLGRSLAFTSDVLPAWSADFARTEDFARLWSQSLEWMLPSVLEPGITATVEQHGDDLKIFVEVTDPSGQPMRNAPVRVVLAAPNGYSEEVSRAIEVRPGVYEIDANVGEPGRYGFEVRIDNDGTNGLTPYQFEFYVPYDARLAFSRIDETLTSSIANATGGEVLMNEVDLQRYLGSNPAGSWSLEAWRATAVAAVTAWFLLLVWRYQRGVWTG